MNATLCGRPVPADRALVMAIVNRTPDSFYDRGSSFSDDAAKARIRQVVAEGADIVDIGGVKAGPGEEVDAATETERVVPMVEWIRERYPDLYAKYQAREAQIQAALREALSDSEEVM